MKLQCIDNNTKKPLSNYKFQVQVKGQNSGYLTFMTDANGYFEVEDKYRDQQFAYFYQGSVSGSYFTVSDGAKFYVKAKTPVTDKSTTQSYK